MALEMLHRFINKDGFRLRGTEMSRIDGFSDVVFGFALTLIVVSLEVPKTYDELHEVILGFFPFAICFVFLIMVWWAHFRFFRLYGTHDIGTILINAALLFMLMFYVYPLKFLFMMLGKQITHRDVERVFSASWQIRELVVVYGLGFAAIYACIVGLYWNAWRQRDHLHLNPLERTLTLTYIWDDVGTALVGIVVVVIAMVIPPWRAGNACWAFFLIGVWKTIHGFITRSRIRAAHARTSPEDLTHSLSHH
jgi:uncharacterized membrane protein